MITKMIYLVMKVRCNKDGSTNAGACRAFDSIKLAKMYIEHNHKTLEDNQQFVIDGVQLDTEKPL